MPDIPVSALKNLGPKCEGWLREVGVHTRADLERLGIIDVYWLLKARRPKQINVVMLYALAGAMMDLHWNQLPPEMVAELKRVAKSPPTQA